MDEIEQVAEPQEESQVESEPEPERHPADTLNDGSVAKLIFFLPALVLHTFLAVWLVTWALNVAARSLWLTPIFSRSTWLTAVYFYVGSMIAGLSWSPRLDRWLFTTSRFVWILPLGWSLYFFFPFVKVGDLPHAIGFFFATYWFFVGGVVPLLVSIGYCVGAWIRRTSGDEVPEFEKAIEERAARLPAKAFWERVVELWRAGRRA